jgi:hypothetical protein
MAYAFGMRIDGAEIPPPSSYTFYERDLVTNSHRNARGTAVWDIVRRNVGELELTWENIGGERLRAVMSAARGKTRLNVRFFNPGTGGWEMRAFYPGDRAMALARYIKASDYWASLTVSFVEI